MLGYGSLASRACAWRNTPSPITSTRVPSAIMATILWPIWFMDSSSGICNATLSTKQQASPQWDACCDRSVYREAKGLSLEENLQRKLQRSSFAREHCTKVVEDGALRFKGVARRTGNALGRHRVGRSTERTGASTRGAAGNKLRMIQ